MSRIFNNRAATQRVFKITAHQDNFVGLTLDEVYNICGNAKADATATQLLQCQQDQIIVDCQQNLQQHCDAQRDYKVFLHYLLELQQTRARVNQQPWAVADSWNHSAGPEAKEMLSTWAPQQTWQISCQLQSQGLRLCAWGRQAAAGLLDFLKTCQWPVEEIGPGGQAYGLSYLELALATMHHMQAYIPVRRTTDQGHQVLVYLSSYEHARREGVTLAEQGENAYWLLQQLEELIPERLLPAVPKGRNRSLYALGEQRPYQGLMLRPSFPCQSWVVETIHGYIQGGRHLPRLERVVPQWVTDIQDAHMPWEQRVARTKPYIRAVRAIRQAKP